MLLRSRSLMSAIALTPIALGMVICSAASDEKNVLRLLSEKSFLETYLDAAPSATRSGRVVGASIIGLQMETAKSKFQSDLIFLSATQLPASKNIVCSRIISRDGKYYSKATYVKPSPNAIDPQLTYRTSYRLQIESYDRRDMAVLIFAASPNCEEKEPVFIPTHDGSSVSEALLVQVRAGDSRLRAQLTRDGKPVTEAVLCSKGEQAASVGFTDVCRLPLSEVKTPGEYLLHLAETTTSGNLAVKSQKVLLQLVSQR